MQRKEEFENGKRKMPPLPPDATVLMVSNTVSRLFDEIVRNDSIEMTNSARMILMILFRDEGITQLELAQRSNLKPPTISVTLAKMESDGFVIRKSDDRDLRQIRVYLTEKGKMFNTEVRRKIEAMDRIALDGFSEQEKKDVTELLKRVANNLIINKEKIKNESKNS